MTLKLTDITSGFGVELFNAQQLANERDGAVEPKPVVGDDTDETYLTSLEQSGQVTIQGGATAPRIARNPNYASDPRTALAEWVAEFDAMLNGAPGDGYELAREYRNDTFSGYIDTLQWTVTGGEALEVGYSISMQRGVGISIYQPPDPVDITVTDTWSINGRALKYIDEFASEKSVDVEVARRAFADTPDENDLSTSSGATRKLTVTGTTVGSVAERNQFDADLANTLGTDTLITVEEGLTGRTFEGMVSAYSSTDEAGRARDADFSVSVVEGTE